MTTHSDIIIAGAGPAGLSFARALADSGLSITLIEKSTLETLKNPPYDGREIALTHLSKEIMQRLGTWQRIPESEIYPLRDAKVLNGRSGYQLHFPQPSHARGEPTDRLGYLISNHNIRKASYEAAAEADNIEFICGVGVKEAVTSTEQAQVVLDNGSVLTAKLLVAADSRFSQTRRQLGIASDMHDYSRTMFLCRMKHTVSNRHTAFECFHYGRTIALLPLEEYLTNTVITVDSDRVSSIQNLSPEALAAIARDAGALLVVDNSFCTPAIQQPLKFGADLSVQSATKGIDGQGRVLGGIICGKTALIKEIAMYSNSAGLALSPFNAWVLLSGVETLFVRMEKQAANAAQIAHWLRGQSKVKAVYYAGFDDHPQAQLARKQQVSGGIVVAFEVEGGQDAAWKVIDSVKVFSKTANLGDVRSTITHPWTTTHGRMSPEAKQEAGIEAGLLRLSVGLENVQDLIADLQQALA